MKLYILAYGAAFAVLSAGAMAQTSGSQRTQEHGPGQMLDYPHEKASPGSDKPMDHRGANMPGSQGMMPDHPHEKAGPGSNKPMDLSLIHI